MNKRVFLFTGPHRSGTYYLNTQIFPNVPGLFNAYTRDPDLNYIVWNAMDENPLFVDIAAVRGEIDAHLAAIEQDAVMLGEEDYFGDYGMYNSDGIYISQPFHDNQRKTALLRQLFDDPKIILTPRRQDKWIESAYMHFIHNYHYFTIDQFIQPERFRGGQYNRPYTSRARLPACNIHSLDWGVYVENYYQVFGRENVLVLPLEMSLADLRGFLDRIYRFIEVEPYYPESVPQVNRSLSRRAYKLALIFNRFIRSGHNRWGFIPDMPFNRWIRERRAKKDTRLLWFLAGISRRINLFWFLRNVVSRYGYERPEPLSPAQRQKVLDHYKEPNKRYAELIGVDLEPYGYY